MAKKAKKIKKKLSIAKVWRARRNNHVTGQAAAKL
jgi:hypothetical protein